MARSIPADGQPRLAYVYHPLSFAPLSITAAAQDICSLVWIVDSTEPGMVSVSRFLGRFGPVIDRAGLALGEVAALVAAHDPDGALSMHDGDLVWTAQLAELLDLPFHSVQSAITLTDKHAQRRALAHAGLVVPASLVIPAHTDAETVAALAAGFDYPAVLKPRLGQASRDTLPIADAPELERTVAELRRPGQPAEEYVLESFIPDPTEPLGGDGFANLVSVESVVEAGRVAHAGISARTPFRWPFRETGFCTPTAIAPDVQSQILQVAEDAAHAMGVTVGCLHTEIKLTDDGPVVIEVNGRPGGGKSEMLERASGFSILKAALRLAVGEPVGLTGPVPCSRVAYQLYVFPETEMEFIDSVEGLSDLAELDGVDEVVLRRGPGQRIDWREGSQAHVFNFAGTTRDHDELRRLIATATAMVEIDGHNAAEPG